MNKKKPAKQKEKKHDFFMKINDSMLFRRNLLESSKSTLTTLKQIYGVKQLREAKKQIIKTIEEELKEIKLLSQKIEHLMPQYKKEDMSKYAKQDKSAHVVKIEMQEKSVQQTQEEPKQKDNEMDALTKTLADIQARLNNI